LYRLERTVGRGKPSCGVDKTYHYAKVIEWGRKGEEELLSAKLSRDGNSSRNASKNLEGGGKGKRGCFSFRGRSTARARDKHDRV